jgi:hypothetical protein
MASPERRLPNWGGVILCYISLLNDEAENNDNWGLACGARPPLIITSRVTTSWGNLTTCKQMMDLG